MMQRVVRPELLDSLPFEDPEALRNRRELAIVNALMGNYRWLERQARGALPQGALALEIGCGTSGLTQRLAQRSSSIRVDGLDRCPPPANWPEGRRWWQSDLLAFEAFERYEAVFANLILHQLDDCELALIGKRLGGTVRALFVSEPVRRTRHLFQFRALVGCLGMGRVSRLDGAASIRAGFLGDELPRLLGLSPNDWAWRCTAGWLGQYRMVATRKERSGK